MNNKEKTRVLFRAFPEGDIVALFPDMDAGSGYIGSYQHIGQHSGASIELIKELRRATKKEYEALKRELEGIGYYLSIGRK